MISLKMYINTFMSAILAGIWIGIGGTAYLSVDNKIIGASLFSVGLFTICIFKLPLYTGRVCDILSKDKYYAIHVLVTWFGNLVGTSVFANLEKLTRSGLELTKKATQICNIKLEDSIVSIFILSIFCNMLIFLAVKGFSQIDDNCKYIPIFIGVIVFILCGFEHCVANMYYFSIAGMWNKTSIIYLIVMTLGNAIGGVMMSKWINLKER